MLSKLSLTVYYSIGTRELLSLKVYDTVQVQNQVGNYPSRWDITGDVVEVRPFDEYVVKIQSRIKVNTAQMCAKFLRVE